MTEQKKVSPTPTTSYSETRVGKTLYRVTSIYLGEKDLKSTLEQLAVKRVLAEMNTARSHA